VGGEVVASGQVELDTDRGRQVWRLMKSGTLGFSFGYLVPEGGAFKRTDGGRTTTRLDVFEITATPAPMNAQTRVLATKAIDEHAAIRTQARRDMFALLTTAEPVATKSVKPIQIASFEC
jgi:phage head maturation protease